jgi:DNA polymerase III subunit epsilon
MLSDRLCALIARRGRPLEVAQVASQLLNLRRCPEPLQRRLVAEIVSADARLAWFDRDLVGLAPPRWDNAGFAGITFCVVDLETTGGQPGSSKVTEIGAVRVRGLQVQERFSTLVDPGRPIPEMITRLTGINDAMVVGMPDITAALDGFVAFAADDVLVAHNAPFDLRFLNYERRRLLGSYFTQPWLDTLTLSRRLVGRGLSRHDLGSLSEWADTSVRPKHRALPDAEATAEILIRLLGMLHDSGCETLSGAVAFSASSTSRYSYKLALAEDLPTTTGVYLMRDGAGQVLYVGKARNLRRRVRAYFGPGGRHSRLIGRALEQLERIETRPCGSEFEALLAESTLLHEMKPPCNRRGVLSTGHYLTVSTSDRYPRLYVTPRPARAGALTFGPVRSERTLRRAIDMLNRLYGLRSCHPLCDADTAGAGVVCHGPCAGGDHAAYRVGVDEVVALLSGDRAGGLAELHGRLAAAAARGDWAPDTEGTQALEALLTTLVALSRVRWAGRRRAVLVEAAGIEGRARLFSVADGRVVDQVDVDEIDWRPVARRRIDDLLCRPPADGAMPAAVLDEAMIIESRLRTRGEPGAILIDQSSDLDGLVEAVGRGVSVAVAEGRRSAERRARDDHDD